MRTIIKLYREHSEAQNEYTKDMKQAVGTHRFKLTKEEMTFFSGGVKHVYASFENWYKQDLPKGENVEIYLQCDVSDDEYYLVTKEYHIYS